jgi:hypothetical protein
VNVHIPIRLAALAPVALVGILLAGCGATSTGSPATSTGNATNGTANSAGTANPTANATQPASGTSASSDAKCTDLTAAAASAAVGKPVTVKLDTAGGSLAGLTVCDVSDAAEVYPIQVDVDTADAQALYSGDKRASGGVDVSGVGDEAFTSAIGVEVLSGGVDIQVIGPAGPVLNKDYTISTAVAKAMVAALS